MITINRMSKSSYVGQHIKLFLKEENYMRDPINQAL